MIEFQNTFKKFGKLSVFEDLNLSIPSSGGIVAVLGPNGSGKTTLIKSILGMVVPDQGSIFFDGKKIQNEWEYRNEINYLPQIATFPGNLTVHELIEMVKDLRLKTANEKELIHKFKLAPFLDKKLSILSGGTKQKVNIVLTFMFESRMLILDEPSTGLDPISLIQLKNLILEEKKKGKTILFTTHIMSLAEEISDEIIFLLEGKIHFRGTIGQIFEKTSQNNLESSIAKILEEEE
ncbi:MAG: ABC transporter ATP-binding protein [Spirochaetia bacterium]|nr:ABC transporter ATP-binding protein [Spirochaetia bacterium]